MKSGWQTRPLGEVCEIQLGGTPARRTASYWDPTKETDNVWLSISDLPMSVGEEVVDSREYLSDEGAEKVKLVPKGTLLFSFKLSIGRIAFAGRDLRTNEAIAALPIKDSSLLSNKYLAWFLASQDWDQITAQDEKLKGRTLNKKKLSKLGVDIPSLAEQKRIVEILDAAFEGIDQAIVDTEKTLGGAERLLGLYRDQVMADVSQNADAVPFHKVAHFVRGPFGGSLKKSCFVPTGMAVYEQQHAINDQFAHVRYFIDDKKFAEMSRFELRPGDLIMSCSGTIGRIAIAPSNLKKGIINQALLKISPKKGLLSWFLRYWMESDSFQRQISSGARGVAIKNVASVKVLKNISVPIPSRPAQEEIVVKLRTFATATDALIALRAKKISSCRDLKASILQAAFSGRFAANDSPKAKNGAIA